MPGNKAACYFHCIHGTVWLDDACVGCHNFLHFSLFVEKFLPLNLHVPILNNLKIKTLEQGYWQKHLANRLKFLYLTLYRLGLPCQTIKIRYVNTSFNLVFFIRSIYVYWTCRVNNPEVPYCNRENNPFCIQS